jgi:hypothetical protein
MAGHVGTPSPSAGALACSRSIAFRIRRHDALAFPSPSNRCSTVPAGVTLAIYAHLFRKREDKAAAAINAVLAGFGKV